MHLEQQADNKAHERKNYRAFESCRFALSFYIKDLIDTSL